LREQRGLIALLVTGCIACSAGDAPEVPSTDVYVVPFVMAGGLVAFDRPVRLSDHPGYDNQPAFTADGSALLYSSSSGSQVEIRRVDLASGVDRRLTRTLESEYSPAPLPAADGFSVVRVEADGRQRIWRFDEDGDQAELVLPHPDYVGYYAWLGGRRLVLFELADPPRLLLADLDDGSIRVVAEDVGRSIQPVPGRLAVSFVHKVADDEWWIVELDGSTGEQRRLAPTLPGREDHAWTPAGELLMADGSRLFHRRPQPDASWEDLADFQDDGLAQISRIAVAPDGTMLALVADE